MTRRSAREEDQVHHSDQDLSELIATGKAQGYLTYDQVNEYLPDEAVNPDKLDSLLVALDDLGISLYNEPPELDAGEPAETVVSSSAEVSLRFEDEAPAKEPPRVLLDDT